MLAALAPNRLEETLLGRRLGGGVVAPPLLLYYRLYLRLEPQQSARAPPVAGVALMLVFSTLRAQTLPELAQAARRVLMFYSVIDCVRAVFNRETVGGRSLNRWDQAAAYTLCAMFLDLVLNWPT